MDEREAHSCDGLPIDGGPLLPDVAPARTVSYSLAGRALDKAPNGGVVHLGVHPGDAFRPVPSTVTGDPDLGILAAGAAVVIVAVVIVAVVIVAALTGAVVTVVTVVIAAVGRPSDE